MMKKLSMSLLCAAAALTAALGMTLTAGAYDRDMPTQAEIREKYYEAPFDLHSAVEYEEDYSVYAPQKAGRISAKSEQEALDCLNFIRFTAGLRSDVKLKEDYSELAQYSSLITYMNYYFDTGVLSHEPSVPYGLTADSELYKLGYEGSSHSNISFGYATLPATIVTAYMFDTDYSNITRVGHRRWILNPEMQYTGFGMVGNGSAMYAFDRSRRAQFDGDYICWPPENMPNELADINDNGYVYSVTLGDDYDTPSLDTVKVDVYSKSLGTTWHLSKNNYHDFSLSSQRTQTNLTRFLNVNTSYIGIPNVIVFNVGSFPKNDKVTVTVSGIYKNGVESPITYTVNYFDLLEDSDGYTADFPEDSYAVRVGQSINIVAYNNPLTNSGYSIKYFYPKGSDPDIIKEYIEYFITDAALSITGLKPTGDTGYKFSVCHNDMISSTNSSGQIDSIRVYVVEDNDLAAADVIVPDMEYTGERLKPAVTVIIDGKTLTLNKDYYVDYNNNREIGTGYVTVTAADGSDYVGERTVAFKIVETLNVTDIRSAAAATISDQTYTGSPITPAVTLTYGGKTLTEGTDYKLSYSSNTSVGTAAVTVTGIGSFSGTKVLTFKIVKAPVSISSATAASIPDQTYTGSALTPAVTLTYGGKTLVKGTDYTLSYENNTEVGTASVTVTGTGDYTGTRTLTFKINKRIVDIASVTVSRPASKTYTGSAITPALTVTFEGKTLVQGTDYTLSYKNNINAGTAAITVTGIGDYSGTRDVTFTIQQKSLLSLNASLSAAEYTIPAIPVLTIKDGSRTLKANTDYKASFGDYLTPGEKTATVDGIGNYSGRITLKYTVKAASEGPGPEDPDDTVPVSATLNIAGEENQPPITVLTLTFKVGEENSIVTAVKEDGSCDKEIAPGTYTIIASAEGCAPRAYTDQTVSGESFALDVTLHYIGDINGTGAFDLSDLGLAISAIKGASSFSDYQRSCGDLSGDGKFDTTDLGLMISVAKNQKRIEGMKLDL